MNSGFCHILQPQGTLSFADIVCLSVVHDGRLHMIHIIPLHCRGGKIAMTVFCLSVHWHISKNHVSKLHKIFCLC